MALWAALAPDAQTVNSYGLDSAIDGYMDFVSPPRHPTTVSPVQLLVKIPPTPHYSDPLLPSPLLCNEDTVMASGDSADIPSSYICTPSPCPLEKGKMQAQELSKVPMDLTLQPIAPSTLPAPSPAPLDLVSLAVMAEKTGKKKGKKWASFAKVATKVKTTPGPPNPPLGPKAVLAQLCTQNPLHLLGPALCLASHIIYLSRPFVPRWLLRPLFWSMSVIQLSPLIPPTPMFGCPLPSGHPRGTWLCLLDLVLATMPSSLPYPSSPLLYPRLCQMTCRSPPTRISSGVRL